MHFPKISDTLNSIFSTFTSRIIAAGLFLVLSILIARVLGPAIKGYLSVISLIGSVCLLSGALGINSFNIYLAAKDKNKIKNLFANSFWFSLVMSLICIGLIFIFYQFFPLIFRNIPPKHLFIYLFSLPFLFFFNIITPILAGEQKFKLYNFFTIFYPFLNLIFIALLLLSHFQSLKFLVAAYSLTNIIIGLLTLILIKPHDQKNLQFDFELFKQALNYGLKIYLATIFAVLVLKVDLYMVNFFRGATEAGLYSLVSSSGDIFFLLPYSIAFIILPKITSQEDNDKAHSISRYFRFTFYLSLILAVGVALFIKPTIQLLYGPTFLSSAETIIIILPGLIILSCLFY
jgi:O-antigen/teichoic acid export membrane protein